MNMRKIRARNIQRQHNEILEANFWKELIDALNEQFDQYEQGSIENDQS